MNTKQAAPSRPHYHDCHASITYWTAKAMREAEARGRHTYFCAQQHA